MTTVARSSRIPSRSSSLPSSKFPQTCPSCGTAFIPDSLFCRKCGERRIGSEVAPADASLELRRPRAPSLRDNGDRERVSPRAERNRSLRQGDASSSSEALRRKEKQLTECRSELVTARAEVKRATEELSKHDASIKGLREQASMWEQEALGLRGRIAAAEAEAHRERNVLEGEASRLRLARDDARRQAEFLQADCNERLARKHGELQDAVAQIERLGKEKNELIEQHRQQKEKLEQQQKEKLERIEEERQKDAMVHKEERQKDAKVHKEERQRDAKVHAQEMELCRKRCEAAEERNRELEQEVAHLRAVQRETDGKLREADGKLQALSDSHIEVEGKLQALNDSHIQVERRNSKLAAVIIEKSQELEDQEREAKESLAAHEQRVRQRAERLLADERRADALKLEAQQGSFAETEVSFQSRVSDELDSAKRKDAAQDATLGSSRVDSHWADFPDSPLLSAPLQASPVERRQMSTYSRCGACGAENLPDSIFCVNCGKRLSSRDDARQQVLSPSRSPRSPSILWSSLRSPELRGAAVPRRVSFLEEELSQTNEREQDAIKSVENEGEAWRNCQEELEERLERMNHERSREQDLAGEERASALLSRSRLKQHESKTTHTAQELHEVRENLNEVRSREASFAESWRQQGGYLEARLERTERERDRLIEATNELRADLRALGRRVDSTHGSTDSGRREADLRSPSPKKDKREGSNLNGKEVRGSEAVRALQQRYSTAKSGPSNSGW